MDRRLLNAKVDRLVAMARCNLLQSRELAEVANELRDKLDSEDASHPKCLLPHCDDGIVHGSLLCQRHRDEAHARDGATLGQRIAHRTDSGSIRVQQPYCWYPACLKYAVDGFCCGEHTRWSDFAKKCEGKPPAKALGLTDFELIAIEDGRAELRDRAATFTLPAQQYEQGYPSRPVPGGAEYLAGDETWIEPSEEAS